MKETGGNATSEKRDETRMMWAGHQLRAIEGPVYIYDKGVGEFNLRCKPGGGFLTDHN
jgi:hypothetical protein